MQKFVNVIGCVGFALACTNTVVGLVFFKSLPATLNSVKSQMLEKVSDMHTVMPPMPTVTGPAIPTLKP